MLQASEDCLPLVPHHQVEEMLADSLLAGVLRGAELHPSVGQGARQEEAFIADRKRKQRSANRVTWGRKCNQRPPNVKVEMC